MQGRGPMALVAWAADRLIPGCTSFTTRRQWDEAMAGVTFDGLRLRDIGFRVAGWSRSRKHIPGVEVISLIGRELDKTQEVAAKYGIGHVATDLSESLALNSPPAVLAPCSCSTCNALRPSPRNCAISGCGPHTMPPSASPWPLMNLVSE